MLFLEGWCDFISPNDMKCSFWKEPWRQAVLSETFPFFPYFAKKQPWNSWGLRFRAQTAMSRWFVKDGICPVQRRFGKNVAYRGALEMGGWRVEGGKNADVTMWVFGHVRSTCAELMVLAVAPFYFVSVLCQANAENLVPLPVTWNACPGALQRSFLCKWNQVTEKLLLSQLTIHWSLWLWGVKMLTCRKSSFYYFGLFVIEMLPEGDALFAALQCFYCGWHHVCSSLFGRSQQSFDKNGLLFCRNSSQKDVRDACCVQYRQ